ncbi:FAS1 domain-containing protein, partial [Hyaloscypha bicolor E]
LAVVLFSISTHAQSLLDALAANNATQFAQFLQANPSILAVYNSSAVQTVFAPTDAYFNVLQRRAANNTQQHYEYQYSNTLTGLETLGPPISPGDVVKTGLPAPQAGGSQVIVSQKSVANSTSTRRRRTVPNPGIQLVSGLGNSVGIINGDIPYSGGLIHTTDSFFTIPSPLSTTVNSTGLSALGTLLNRANLSNTFDAADSVTIFTPNNAAFAAAANYNSNAATLPNLLSNHVIPNFLGYLPVLTDGAVYQTLANETLTISIKNGVYYVNGAKIISSNTILSNGVAHVIDQASLRLVSRVEGLCGCWCCNCCDYGCDLDNVKWLSFYFWSNCSEFTWKVSGMELDIVNQVEASLYSQL